MRAFRVVQTILFLMFISRPCILLAQQKQPSCEILSQRQVSATINDSVKMQFAIDFRILRVYRYVDRSGQYYCVLTEKLDTLAPGEDGKYDTFPDPGSIFVQSVSNVITSMSDVVERGK